MFLYPHLWFHILHFTFLIINFFFTHIFKRYVYVCIFFVINGKIRFEPNTFYCSFHTIEHVPKILLFFGLNIDFMHTELLACRIFSNTKSISSAFKCDLLLFIYDNQDPFEKESCTNFMGMAWLILVHNFSA